MKGNNFMARQSRLPGVFLVAMCVPPFVSPSAGAAPGRDYPYFEVEGTAEDFRHYRHWRQTVRRYHLSRPSGEGG